MNQDEFIAKSLKSLQKQIDKVTKENDKLSQRIESLEEFNSYNNFKGNVEYPPYKDEIVVRTAAGRIAYQVPIGEVVNDGEEVNDAD